MTSGLINPSRDDATEPRLLSWDYPTAQPTHAPPSIWGNGMAISLILIGSFIAFILILHWVYTFKLCASKETEDRGNYESIQRQEFINFCLSEQEEGKSTNELPVPNEANPMKSVPTAPQVPK